MDSDTPSPPDPYALFSAGNRPALEALAGPRPAGVLASMLSGMSLRAGDSRGAARTIPGVSSAEERTLKAKTLEYLSALRARLADEPEAHLLILTCNRAGLVENALRQLAATDYGNYAVYILDNGSTDGTWDIVRRARDIFPAPVPVSVTRLPFNAGRPVGHNLLLTQYDHSAAGYIAIGDDDLVRVPPDWLRRMIVTAQCFPRAAVIGGKALSPGSAKRIHGGVRRLTLFTTDELETTNANECPDVGQFDYIDMVDHVIGCLHLYRAKPLFSDIGLFDVRYSPCQCVDLDHHFRTRLCGYEIVYNGLVEFVHAREMGNAAQFDQSLKGNALGNLAKLIYKFNESTMNELIAATARQRREWLSGSH